MSLNLAVKYARLNPILPKGRNSISRFACVVTDGYRVFVGLNSYKSSPLQAKFSKKAGLSEEAVCIHAELSAISKAARSGLIPDKARVYVARVLKNGEPALAMPCLACQAALIEFGYRNVVWTLDQT